MSYALPQLWHYLGICESHLLELVLSLIALHSDEGNRSEEETRPTACADLRTVHMSKSIEDEASVKSYWKFGPT